MRLRIGLIAAIRTIVGFRFVIEAQAFGGVDMHYDRVVNVFDLVQYFHQRVNVITLLHIAVVQAECLNRFSSAMPFDVRNLASCPYIPPKSSAIDISLSLTMMMRLPPCSAALFSPSNAMAELRDPSPIMAITLPIVLSPAARAAYRGFWQDRRPEKSKCRYGRAQRNHVRFPADS